MEYDEACGASVAGDPACYDLAYQAALHALDEQASALRNLRDRARVVFTIATVAIGFAVGLLYSDNSSSSSRSSSTLAASDLEQFGLGFALAGFTLVILTSLWVWAPARGWFVQDASTIIDYYIEGDTPLDKAGVQRELARNLADDAYDNNLMLSRRSLVFMVGLAALLVEIAGVVISLGGFVYE